MRNDKSNSNDKLSERRELCQGNSSERLSADSPEVNTSNLDAAFKANPNRTDTLSPDGKSRFHITCENTTDPWQERREKIAQSITEQRKDSLSNYGSTEVISQAQPPGITRKAVYQAAQIFTGEAKAAVNFAVSSLAGIGDLVRMADAAHREIHPLRNLLPDTDPEGTKKLHDTCAGLSVGARIMIQYDTTFNPGSPLYGKVFDPEGAQMARQLALSMPGKLKAEIGQFQKLDTVGKAEKQTELALNIWSLAQGGGIGMPAKSAEISRVIEIAETGQQLSALSKSVQVVRQTTGLESLTKEMHAFSAHLKKIPNADRLKDLVKAVDAAFPQKDLAPLGPKLGDMSKADQGFEASKNGLHDLFHPKVYVKDGMEMKLTQAAHETGIPRERLLEKTPEELALLGIKVYEPSKYHVNGSVLTEAQLAKKLDVTKQELREMPPLELGKKGVTEIEQVNGRYPINCEWAGKTFPFKDKYPGLYKELCKEFPQFAKELEKGVKFTESGYPDLKPFSRKEYQFRKSFHADRNDDFFEADKAIWKDVKTRNQGLGKRKELDLTWHHVERKTGEKPTLQLVPTKLHKAVKHTGGVATQEATKMKKQGK